MILLCLQASNPIEFSRPVTPVSLACIDTLSFHSTLVIIDNGKKNRYSRTRELLYYCVPGYSSTVLEYSSATTDTRTTRIARTRVLE